MHTLLNPLYVVVLFVLVFAGDTAISAARGNAVVRAIVYSLVALLALIALIVALL